MTEKPLKFKQTGESLLHWIEIGLGVLVLIAVIITTVYQFGALLSTNWGEVNVFLELLKTVLQLAIGVEIARLLFSYSLETIIELAAFVVARKLLLLEGDFISLILGISALVMLFGARHFFMEDDTKLEELRKQIC